MDTEAPDRAEQEGVSVQWRLFLGIATFVGLNAAVYWFASYEQAGTTMLALSAGLALFCGVWLFVQDRKRVDAAGGRHHAGEPDPPAYLPHASLWPFVVGLGAAVCANALILGFAYAVPGAVIIVCGLGGFVAEGRRRA